MSSGLTLKANLLAFRRSTFRIRPARDNDSTVPVHRPGPVVKPKDRYAAISKRIEDHMVNVRTQDNCWDDLVDVRSSCPDQGVAD